MSATPQYRYMVGTGRPSGHAVRTSFTLAYSLAFDKNELAIISVTHRHGFLMLLLFSPFSIQ